MSNLIRYLDIPTAAGGGLEPDWTLLTDAGFGAKVDTNSRASDLSYDSGTGRWSITWNSGGSALARFISEDPPYRLLPLGDIAPADFTWDTHSIEFMLMGDHTTGINSKTSPYFTGLATGLVRTDLSRQAGIYFRSATSTNANVGDIGATILTALGGSSVFVAVSMLFRSRYLNGPLVGQSSRLYTTGALTGGFGSYASASAQIGNDALADLNVIVQGHCGTASALAVHTQTLKIYYRIVTLPGLPDIAALPSF